MKVDTAALGGLAAAVTMALALIALRPRTKRADQPPQALGHVARQLERVIQKVPTLRRQRREVPPEDVAEWCDQIARRMRSGSTIRDALMSTEPSSDAARHATDGLRLGLDRGLPVPEALETIPDNTSGRHSPRTGPHVALAFGVIAVASRLGGSNAAALDRTATSLRVLAADRHERRSQASQARLSAHVLTVVPLAMLSLLLLLDSDVRATLHTPIGAACVTSGLFLNGVGWRWMHHMIGAYQ
jgi:Flp pilus assembly protein TadB